MEFINFEFIIRISAALILGFLIGLEREITNKYAGLRTHILVCLGACIFTIISIYGFPTFADGDNVIINQATGIRDTARVAAQILTGIGFIGAGTVLRNGPIIVGLTTAATLWISASIGMACGVGMYDIAIFATAISVAVLTLIRIFERKFLSAGIKRVKRFKVVMYCENPKVEEVRAYLSSVVDKIEEFSYKKLIENPENSRITSVFELSNTKIADELYKSLSGICAADALTLQELND